MVTYESILEGVSPNRLFWLPRMEPPATTSPGGNDKPASHAPDSRNAPNRPFASRREPWLRTEYRGLTFSHTREGEADLFRWQNKWDSRLSNHPD